MVRKKTDPAFIRHYLMDEFQLDPKTIDLIFRKLGISEFDQGPQPPAKK